MRQALAIAPGFVAAHNNLGLALVKAGKVDEAVEEYRQAARAQHERGRAA